MKTRNVVISALAILAFVLSVALVSCNKEEAHALQAKVFYDAVNKTSLSLENQAELNHVATSLSKETKQITLLQDATLVELTDRKGDYKAISVSYKVGEVIVKMMIPIAEVSSDKVALKDKTNTNAYYVVDAESCVMKCSSDNLNEACAHEIIERCKSQTCGCGVGITSEASVAFNNE